MTHLPLAFVAAIEEKATVDFLGHYLLFMTFIYFKYIFWSMKTRTETFLVPNLTLNHRDMAHCLEGSNYQNSYGVV